ncbi:MAG: hypothetical protein ACOC1F_02765, partial [Myxococcota bacterium]
GAGGDPAPSPDGLAVEETEYDAFGRVKLRRFLGVDGTLLGETRVMAAIAADVSQRLGVLRAEQPALFRGGGIVVAGAFAPLGAPAPMQPGDILVKLGAAVVFDQRDIWFFERGSEALEAVVIRHGEAVAVEVTPKQLGRIVFE